MVSEDCEAKDIEKHLNEPRRAKTLIEDFHGEEWDKVKEKWDHEHEDYPFFVSKSLPMTDNNLISPIQANLQPYDVPKVKLLIEQTLKHADKNFQFFYSRYLLNLCMPLILTQESKVEAYAEYLYDPGETDRKQPTFFYEVERKLL